MFGLDFQKPYLLTKKVLKMYKEKGLLIDVEPHQLTMLFLNVIDAAQ